MPDFEAMAEFTCGAMLSATHLESICRYRGFVTEGKKNKVVLTATVAPRLVGTEGVRDAMTSLEPTWRLVLHKIALSPDTTTVRDLFPVVFPDRGFHSMPAQGFFKLVADKLLSRGVAFVEDRPSLNSYSTSRYEKLAFHIVPEHRPLLPDFPVATHPLPAPTAGSSATAFDHFFRAVLGAALRHSADKNLQSGGEGANDILSAIAKDISVNEGEIRYKAKKIKDLAACYGNIRREWEEGLGVKRDKKRSPPAFVAIRHILAHLPPGQGALAGDLANALASLGFRAEEEDIATFCEAGNRMGMVVKGLFGRAPLYRAGEEAGHLSDIEAGALVFDADKTGIVVDVAQSATAYLLAVASLCHAEIKNSTLHLSPSIPLMGRVVEALEGDASLNRVRSASKAFDAALCEVLRRHRTLLVHQGLQVLKVDDLGLRTMLLHRFADWVRPLEGPYLAAVKSSMGEVEKLIRSEGFSPRLEK